MIQPVCSQRATQIKESATLAINQKAKALRAAGREIFHFGFGQSPFPVHPKIEQALRDNAHQKDYLPTFGLPELREQVSGFLKRCFEQDYPAESIVIGPGSKELLFNALYVLEGPLLLPAPCWVSYGPQAHLIGKPIVPIVTKRENGYKLTAADLERVCKETTSIYKQKILVLTSPNNPTGTMYTEKEVREISEIARRHEIIVIADEIYAHTRFIDGPYEGFAKFYPEGTIVTGGLSKSLSGGGWRLGFMAVPAQMKEVLRCLAGMISETFSCVCAPVQYAAVTAFADDDEIMGYVRDCAHIHRLTGNYLHQRFVGMGLNCPKPEGAFYLMPDFQNFRDQLARRDINGSNVLGRYLLEEYGVAMLPGTDFFMPDENLTFRVATVDYDGRAVYDAFIAQKKIDPVSFVEEHCPSLKGGADAIERFLKAL